MNSVLALGLFAKASSNWLSCSSLMRLSHLAEISRRISSDGKLISHSFDSKVIRASPAKQCDLCNQITYRGFEKVPDRRRSPAGQTLERPLLWTNPPSNAHQ